MATATLNDFQEAVRKHDQDNTDAAIADMREALGQLETFAERFIAGNDGFKTVTIISIERIIDTASALLTVIK